MSGFDITAAKEGLLALLLTASNVEEAQLGSPEAGAYRIGAWILLGDINTLESTTTGMYELDFNLIVHWRYTVEGNEGAGEAALGDFVTDFAKRIIQNRMGSVDGVGRYLNGSVDRMWPPQAALSPSDYALMAGAEQRVYPFAIRVVQRENFGV